VTADETGDGLYAMRILKAPFSGESKIKTVIHVTKSHGNCNEGEEGKILG
jgi:hypothetical protein